MQFFDNLTRSISEAEKLCGIHRKYEEKLEAKDLLDVVADSIVGMFYAVSELRTPKETRRWILLRSEHLLGYGSDSGNYALFVRKVCRTLRSAFEEKGGVYGIRVLILCLENYGFKRMSHSSRDKRLLNRFTILFAKYHLLAMYQEASRIDGFELPDGIIVDANLKRLTKTTKDIYGDIHESVLTLVG